MANEIIKIGPVDIARLLFPLKKSPGETRGCLMERVKSELNLDHDEHAGWAIDFLEAAEYLRKDRVKVPWGSFTACSYSLTPKGRELTENKKYL